MGSTTRETRGNTGKFKQLNKGSKYFSIILISLNVISVIFETTKKKPHLVLIITLKYGIQEKCLP